MKYFDSTSYGNVLSRVTNDIDTIGQTLNNSLGMLVTSIATFIGAIDYDVLYKLDYGLTGILSTMIGFSLMTCYYETFTKIFW